jgi:PAS domain S-box-containing protein
MVRPRTDDEPAWIVLRLLSDADSGAAFRVLNHRLATLREEMAVRRKAHAAVQREHEWLRVTLMSIGDAVVTTDSQGRVELMNKVAQALTGWKQEEAHGRRLAEVFRIVDERTRMPSENPVDRVLEEGVTVGLANHTLLLSRDGAEWPIDDSAAPIRDEAGRVVGAVLVFHEISERRRLEQLAASRLTDLDDANRRKDEFLAMLSHELRNPLAPIRLATSILKDPKLGPSVGEQARSVIERQVVHMVRLVDDLLDISRITRGLIELRKEPVELATVLRSALETTRALIAEGTQRLEAHIPDELATVFADPTRLEQVFSNLLHNAAKYTPHGGRIELTAFATPKTVTVRVRDEGIGMEPDLLAHVFDLFVQGDTSLHRSQGGLGIGLTLVRHLLGLHEGTVVAHSAGVDRGSEFVVTLPVHVAASRTSSVEPPPAPAPAAPPLRMLVVDDNVDAAELMMYILTAEGHVVEVAHDGPSALERAALARPEVVLLDIGLPGMDGYEVARRLKREPTTRDAMLIALTGYGQEEHRLRAAEAGFALHLTKPLEPRVLLQLVREWAADSVRSEAPQGDDVTAVD